MAPFNVVQTYNSLLTSDPDLTMPVAAIQAMIAGLAATPTTTTAETLDLVSKLAAQLKAHIPNALSLSAGTDLFKQYLLINLRSAGQDFAETRARLVANGAAFLSRAKAAREQAAEVGRQFVRDGSVVLTPGGSRAVAALLRQAASSGTRFKVIYTSPSNAAPGAQIPTASVPTTAVAHILPQTTTVLVGAECVVENGGVISALGTYQLALLARAQGRPFFVVAETHKFVREFPLGQGDLGVEQSVVEFRTAGEGGESHEGVADMDLGGEEEGKHGPPRARMEDAVDYTPPELISAIITESGVLLPGAVSEELIKMWN